MTQTENMQSINDLEIFKRAIKKIQVFLRMKTESRKSNIIFEKILIAELGNKYTVFATISF